MDPGLLWPPRSPARCWLWWKRCRPTARSCARRGCYPWQCLLPTGPAAGSQPLSDALSSTAGVWSQATSIGSQFCHRKARSRWLGYHLLSVSRPCPREEVAARGRGLGAFPTHPGRSCRCRRGAEGPGAREAGEGRARRGVTRPPGCGPRGAGRRPPAPRPRTHPPPSSLPRSPAARSRSAAARVAAPVAAGRPGSHRGRGRRSGRRRPPLAACPRPRAQGRDPGRRTGGRPGDRVPAAGAAAPAPATPEPRETSIARELASWGRGRKERSPSRTFSRLR
ncbi:uncharacterized protein LOC128930290 isoform X1 [Callithrix jacchus]